MATHKQHLVSTEVVMVPFPEQSHLNQLLQLSHVISSSHNVKVHYVATSLHVSQVKSRAAENHDPSNNPMIEFHALDTPEFPSPAPSDPSFPSHLIPSFNASLELRSPVSSLIKSLSAATAPKRLVVIHDPMMSSVVHDSLGLPNVEAYVFFCISAVSHLVMTRDALGLKIRDDLPSAKGTVNPDLVGFVECQFESLKAKKRAGIVYNTSRIIESEFLEWIEEHEKETDPEAKVWAFGPLETVTKFKKKSTLTSNLRHKCLKWLDKQEKNSVLYVSFGTTTFMRDEQIGELAKGLEESGTKFIWVLRDADRANIFKERGIRKPKLPLGLEERIAGTGMGMVVRDWAPQMEILGHPSTGGFVSHCGWNSCLESLSLGVPLLAWPMHSDQPINAFLVTRILKAGLVLWEWETRHELVSSSVIVGAVKSLMSSIEGEEVRQRAEELGCQLRKSTKEGGVSRMELNSFIAHITRV